MTIVNPKITNFTDGIDLKKNFSFNEDLSVTKYVIIDPQFNNISGQEFLNYDPALDQILTLSDLTPGQFDVTLQGP